LAFTFFTAGNQSLVITLTGTTGGGYQIDLDAVLLQKLP
jgi:hypothetical protein